jgi:hypothetical protein
MLLGLWNVLGLLLLGSIIYLTIAYMFEKEISL